MTRMLAALSLGAALALCAPLASPATAQAAKPKVQVARPITNSGGGPVMIYISKAGDGEAVITQKRLPNSPQDVVVLKTPPRPAAASKGTVYAGYAPAYPAGYAVVPGGRVGFAPPMRSAKISTPFAADTYPGGAKAAVLSSINWYSRFYGLDPALVQAVAEAESNFQPGVVSHKGAQGVMQIMPQTGQELGLSDPFDPESNVEAGVRYLKQLLDRYGHTELALAAYNAGPGNVDRHAGVPPFAETQNYVQKVLARYQALSGR